MTRNQIVICVKRYLDSIYPSDNNMQNAMDIIDEFEELIRADAINECINAIKNCYTCEIIMILEQLKNTL